MIGVTDRRVHYNRFRQLNEELIDESSSNSPAGAKELDESSSDRD
jgi:hypothetical protein